MSSTVKIYTTKPDELHEFLTDFFLEDYNFNNNYWEKSYSNPIEIADIVAAFVDNKYKYDNTNMWISIDPGVFINIKEDNYNYFIKYLFERYPY